MKDITRIHIAKVSYDSEIEAKKSLETYLETLKQYADADLEADVEIRITELLAERGIKKDGVITSSDIAAIRAQLGEPRDFAIEADTSDVAVPATAYRKRLYRDKDIAIVGGVMSGIGAYFGINAWWVRAIAAIVFFVTGGAAILAYIVLWVAVPVARTAAQRIEMNGQAATVEAIQRYNENSEERQKTRQRFLAIRRTMLTVVGTLGIIAAAATLMVTVYFTVGLYRGDTADQLAHNPWIAASVWLMALSGILLAALLALIAYAALVQKISRRLLIAASAVIIAGLLTFFSALIIVSYDTIQYDRTNTDTSPYQLHRDQYRNNSIRG